mmetsp:Transcript_7354/g.20761  ORF Transcript_7354/g.20761 Transcript_7354/m.20761 type:complete len:215 (-) Transcript_7354:2132-2776(-)
MSDRLASSQATASTPPLPPSMGRGSQYRSVTRATGAPLLPPPAREGSPPAAAAGTADSCSSPAGALTITGRIPARASSSHTPQAPLLNSSATRAMGSDMEGGAARGTTSPDGATCTRRTVPWPELTEEERPVEVSQRTMFPSASPSTMLVPQAASAIATYSLLVRRPWVGRLGWVSPTLRPLTASTPTRPSPRAKAMRSSGTSSAILSEVLAAG